MCQDSMLVHYDVNKSIMDHPFDQSSKIFMYYNGIIHQRAPPYHYIIYLLKSWPKHKAGTTGMASMAMATPVLQQIFLF